MAAAAGVGFGAGTFWRAASLSKIVTARVVERAGLAWGQDAGAALGFPLRHPAFPGVPVTLGMLGAHVGGLTDAGGYLLPPGVALADWMAGAVWGDRPGAGMEYCNLAYVLLAAAAERATGRRFDHLASGVLADLGVPGGFNWSGVAERADRMAIVRRDGGRFLPQVDAVVAPRGVSLADGAEADLTAWAPGRNPGVFSPQGGLRTTLAGALRLAVGLRPRDWLWQGAAAASATAPGLMRLDLGGRSLIGHFACAYGMVGGAWADPATGGALAYVLNGLPVGDDSDDLRPEELSVIRTLAALI